MACSPDCGPPWVSVGPPDWHALQTAGQLCSPFCGVLRAADATCLFRASCAQRLRGIPASASGAGRALGHASRSRAGRRRQWCAPCVCARILPAPAGARCGKLPRSCMLGGTSSGSTEGCGCAYMHADGRLPFFIRMPCERPRRELGGPRSPRSFRVHRCERPNSRVRNRSFARHCANTARYDLIRCNVVAGHRPDAAPTAASHLLECLILKNDITAHG